MVRPVMVTAAGSTRAGARTGRGMVLKRAWVASVVGYTILRAVIAWGLFRDHGLNPWIFAALDIGTAVPYATAIAELPGAIMRSDRRGIARHVVVAFVSFLLPYAYVWVAVDDAPTNLRTGLGIFVVIIGIAAALGVWRRARTGDAAPAPI